MRESAMSIAIASAGFFESIRVEVNKRIERRPHFVVGGDAIEIHLN
jgi:hypothetical protein